MARPVEREDTSTSTLSPAQVQEQSQKLATFLNAQTAVDVAQAKASQNPKSVIYQQGLETAKAALDVAKTAYGTTQVSASSSSSASSNQNVDDKTATPSTDPLAMLQKSAQDAARKDAFKMLEDTFAGFGLQSLSATISKLMKDNVGPNEAALMLKQTPEYKQRFAGNFDPTYGRAAKGLNVLTEAEYLGVERTYGELMQQYGVSNLANRNQFAQLIGGDVSTTELQDRLNLAVTSVQKADPTVMATLKAYYPNITDANLVSYFLAPEDTLPQLQRQVQAADIGAAAVQQGIPGIGVKRAEQLAGLGVSYAQAQKGYGEIATVLPAATTLSNIYAKQTGATYGQTELENQYLLGSGEAALKQRELNKLELATFSGQSGVDTRAAALGKSIQGAF